MAKTTSGKTLKAKAILDGKLSFFAVNIVGYKYSIKEQYIIGTFPNSYDCLELILKYFLERDAFYYRNCFIFLVCEYHGKQMNLHLCVFLF